MLKSVLNKMDKPKLNIISAIGAISVLSVSLLSLYMIPKLFKNWFKKNEEWHEIYFSDSYSLVERNKFNELMPNLRRTPAILQRLVQLIDSAEFAISLCIYTCTCTELAEAIIRAQERGVRVRIIGCSSMQMGLITFAKKDIPLRLKGSSSGTLMHHKFCLIDVKSETGEKSDSDRKRMKNLDKLYEFSVKDEIKSIKEKHRTNKLDKVKLPENGLLITGSMNWTMQGLIGNWENVIILSNKDVLREYQKEFEKLWMAE